VDDYTYSVAQLSREIGDAIAWRFPEPVWLRGEIRNMSRARSGHVYFSLVGPAEESDAKIPVTLFLPDKEEVNRVLMASGGTIRMDDGIEIRIRGPIQHYPGQSTVQMRMTTIDPAFTVGQLEIQRARVLATLRGEGLLDRNRSVPFPLVPMRVGLLTSAGSAAEADVVQTLRGSPYAFDVTTADVRVQGTEAVASLVHALNRMNDRPVDVVLIARGGGAATDLAVFDDETLARAIAGSLHPILTGIGHQTDQSIADLVAGQSFKTPTDAAHGLIARVTHFMERLAAAENRTVTSTRHRLERAHGTIAPLAGRVARSAGRTLGFAGNRVATAGSILSRVATLQTATAGARLDQAQAALDRRATARLARSQEHIASLLQQLSVVHPRRTLARGWSIARAADGAALRSVKGVTIGDAVTVELTDGKLATSITDITDRIDP
jgi:exodeoxyribonuclease VII large subunit